MTETVTLPRAEVEKLREQIEDLQDRLSIAERRDEPRLSLENAELLFDGAHPVTVWRKQRGLTQRALARDAGVSSSMLNEIESRKREPSLSTLRAIAKVLGVDASDLVED